MQQEIHFLKKINKIIVIINCIGGVAATGGLLFDYLSGTRTLYELLLIFLVTMGSAIANIIIYKRYAYSNLIKHIFMTGFLFYYGFLYITYPSFLPFVFIFPILTLDTLYASKKRLAFDIVLVLIINVVGTVIKLKGMQLTTELQSTLIMQFGSLIAFISSIYLVVHIYSSTREATVNAMDKLNKAQEIQKNILSDILNLARILRKTQTLFLM